MDRLRIALATLVFASVSLFFCTSTAFSQAQLTTDMLDYSPGETAIFTGSGFFAEESVTVQVLHADGSPATGEDHDPWTVLSDSAGSFITTWHVCTDDCLYALLRATAVGQTSGHSAEALFTDGPTPDYTASITPTTGLTGSLVAYTLTVTNIVTSEQGVGSVSVAIPTGAGTPSSVTVSASDPGPTARTWAIDGSPPAGFMRFSRSGASANDIDPGGTIVIGFTATATTTGSKTWTTVAYKNNNYTSAGVLTGTQPVVTICSAISITTNPADQTLCAGNSASFSAVATGTPTPTLQWQVSTDGGSTWSNIAGSTSSPLTFTTSASQTGNKYRAVFSNTCSSANSTSATLTVNTKPVITCPTSFSVNNDPATCGAVVNFTGARSAIATGSPAPVIVYTPASGSVFPVGTTTVKAKATNTCGADSCTFTVTVVDNQKPSITCPSNIVRGTAAGNCSAVVSFSVTSSDNCPGVSVSSSPASGSVFPLGVTTVKSIATDAAGNKDSCSFTVTVIDTTKPNAQCQAVTLHLDASGNVSLTAAQVNNGSSDACGIKSIAIDKTSFTCSDVGANTVTLTVTDNNNNVSTCTATVTVRDLVRPSIVCPANMVKSTDPGLCSAVVTFNVTGSDNCAGYVIVSVPSSGSVFLKGTTSVKSIITDASGNKDSCVFSVTVNDNEKPKVTCPANITTLTDSAKCSAVVNFSATATDNCAGVTIVSTPPSGFVFPKGSTIVKCVAIDAAGNRDSCTFTVTVNNPAPIATITGPASGSIFAVGTPVSLTGTFTDNPRDVHTAQWMLDAVTVNGTVNEVSGTASGSYTFTAAGVYFVKLTVTDQCGNASTATTVGGFDAMVVIYDPAAGFVTGGGWITSPTGAYRADTTLTGKANFGFVSKYKKGQSIPTGETEFQFKLGNVNFHSSSYDWLVISGPKAQYKGSGTINGTGNFAFILTAIDGQINGGGGIDKFRMKISNKSTGAIVYDNQFGKSDTSAPSTALGGGSIVIHTGGGGSAAGLNQRSPGDEGNFGGGLPTEFALQQNFPNPFNPSTLIKYQLPEASHVSLIVYNMIGQQVSTLIDGVEEAGYKSVQWNADVLPSGMYFYKIVAGSFSETRKMVLVK